MSSTGKSEASPRIITMNIGHRLMVKAEQTVRRDKYQSRFECLHEVMSPAGSHRLGFYRLVLYYIDEGDKDRKMQTSHLFDMQVMLDMSAGWEEYVEKKVLGMMSDIFGGGTSDD